MIKKGISLKKQKGISLVVLLALLIGIVVLPSFPSNTVLAAGNTYYVSTSGSDTTGTGSISNPFKTIQKAANIMSAGDTCIIRGGTYRETVTPPTSGSSGAPIVFKPYTGETVTISGADIITGWSVYSGSIYSAPMSWNLADGNQIFVNGNMMTEARWPNNVGSLLEPTLGVVDSGSGTTLIDDAITQANNFFAGAKLWCVGGVGYLAKTTTVTSSSQSSHSVSFASGSFYEGYGPTPGSKYFMYGKLNLLDIAKEWYYDSTTSRIYLYAPNGSNPSTLTVEAKKRMNAIDLSGRSYITFDGINVFAATVVTNSSTSNCIYKNATAKYLSHSNNMDDGWAAQWDYGFILSGTNNEINSCTLQYSSSALISLSGNGNKVINSLVSDANYAASAFGLLNITGSNHLISHNTLTNAGRSIIYARANISNLDIGYNNISYGGRLTKDIGIIYIVNTDGQNTRIHHNWVHDNAAVAAGSGIYLDNYTHNFIVDHNVVWNSGTDGNALTTNTPSDNNLIYNNTLYDGRQTFWGAGTYALEQDRTQIFNNIYGRDCSIAPGAIYGNNIPYTTNPQFVNPASNNFRLSAGSPAINAGIVVPGITDGYVGAAPDCGAYEYNGTNWTPGHNFSTPPAPTHQSVNTPYKNRVINGGFENGNLTAWTKTGAQTATVIYDDAWEHAPLHNGMARSQLYGLRLAGVQDGVEQTITGLEANTKYAVYAWGKVSSSNDSLAIGVKSFGGAEKKAYFGGTSWTQRVLEFTTGPSNTSVTLYFEKTGSSGGYAYCDDMALIKSSVYKKFVLSSEDAYVRDGSYASTIMGYNPSDPFVFAKNSATSGQNKKTFIKYDLRNIPDLTVTGAVLKIKLYSKDSGSVNTSLKSVSNDSWSENSITWNNMPSRGNAVSSLTITNNSEQWLAYDITSYVQSEMSGDKIVSLCLEALTNDIESRMFPKEYAETVKPWLELTFDHYVDQYNPEPVIEPTGSQVQANLSSYYNVDGFSYDTNRSNGHFDSEGNSYSADLINSNPTFEGTTYTLGPKADNLNNVVSAIGQTINLTQGKYSSVRLLSSATGGEYTVNFRLNYSDATFSDYSVLVKDWCSGDVAGQKIVQTMAHRHFPTQDHAINTYVFAYYLTPTVGKTVTSIGLPNNSNVKVLAITMNKAQVQADLSTYYNIDGFSYDTNRSNGQFDNDGNSYSADLINSNPTYDGTTYTLGPKADNLNNVVRATGQTINLTQGQYSSVRFLSAATGGEYTVNFRVNYSDSTFTNYSVLVKDWCSGYVVDQKIVQTMSHRHLPTQDQAINTYIFAYYLTPATGKTVTSIVLPDNTNVKIFAITLEP